MKLFDNKAFILCNVKLRSIVTLNHATVGGIPYTAHRPQITPPPLSFTFVTLCFYAYFRLG